jgi:hypothetical protein
MSIVTVVSDALSSTFSYFKSKSQTFTPTKRRKSSANDIDLTEDRTANEALTKGLYYGSYPGLKLSSNLAKAPVDTLVSFMGIPSFKDVNEDDDLNEMIKDFTESRITDMQKIHKQSMREGTLWVFPWYSSELRRVVWRFIPDASVKTIIKNVETYEPEIIITEEDITVSTGMNSSKTITKIVKYTATRIDTSYSDVRQNTVARNPIGMLPIPFSNDADANELRGHSVYSAVISLFKNYHDISLAEAQLLSKFKAKLVAGIDNPDDFAQANGYSDAEDFFTNFELYDTDILLYQAGQEEKPEILHADITANHAQAKKDIFKNIVEGMQVPEIAWGLKTEGNMASVEENMSTLINCVEKKRKERNESWLKLMTASLRLERMASMSFDSVELMIEWNKLDNVSDKTKADIFKSVAEGIARLVDTSSISKEILYNLLALNFPGSTEDTYEEFKEGLNEMAIFNQFKNASIEAGLGEAGIDAEEFGDPSNILKLSR